jgi:diguanylate cyclase (GGDEF)-like protein/PAS domain S-box-containing protein
VNRSGNVTVGDWWSETVSGLGAFIEASNSRSSHAPGGLGVLVVSNAGTVEACCHNMQRMLRCTADDIRGAPIGSILPGVSSPETLRQHANQFRALASDAPEVLELCARRPDGSLFPVVVADARLGSATRQPSQLLIYDLSSSHAAKEQADRFSMAVEQTADAVAITDRRGTIQYVNRAFEQMTGYSRHEAVGKTMAILRSGRHNQHFYANLWNTILSGRVFRARFANRRKDGEMLFEEKTISPLRDANGDITHFVSTAKDVSDRIQAEERLFFLANHDTVTGLPNRNLLVDRLGHALALCHRNAKTLALLCLDLDRFRFVNDTLGHQGGDELLRAVGERLRGCVRQADTVARVGGDEFVIALALLSSDHDAQQVVEKIMASFKAPFPVHERDIYISASVGVSLGPRDGSDVQRLLRYADLAMYQAKAAGRNRYLFFDRSMDKAASENLALATSLRGALKRGELALHYQPQVDVASGTVAAVEALLRWQHPDRGIIPPDRFVPLLEDMGMIGEVSEWVIETACSQIRALSESGSSIGLAINLSNRQFADPRLPQVVDEVLSRVGLDPSLLEFEITESTLMEDVPTTTATLTALAERGISIAIDDFGTGYSSLSYLKRFSVDVIKIDRSFVWDAMRDPDAAAIVKAVVSLGRELSLSVIAEGVETAEQFEFLRSLQCARVQGFLISRPLPYDGLCRFLAQGLPPVPRSRPR